MKRQDLTIEDPCHEDWTGMEDRGARRFCDACTKEVHDLSWLTEDEAGVLLSEGRGHLCVRYAFDTESDEILFRDETSPKWRMYRQQEGVKALMAAAMVAAPLLMAGCEPAPATDVETPTVVSPIEIGEIAPKLGPAAPKKPTFEAKPLPTPTPVMEPVVGALEPETLGDPGAARKPTFQVKKKETSPQKKEAAPVIVGMGDVVVHPPKGEEREKKKARKKKSRPARHQHVFGFI